LNNKINFVAHVAPVALPKAGTADIDFDERAAILEYDGGLDRDEADAQAKDELDIP
jgi:hypothetical protein